MFSITNLVRPATNFVSDNAPALLTAFGAVGTVGTAVLAGKASFEAADKLREARLEAAAEKARKGDVVTDKDYADLQLSKTEAVKVVWPLYVPAVTTGTVTVAAIILSHRISSRRAAVLAAAYALNEGKLEEYQDKIREKFGDKKEKEARNELAQDRINRDWDGNAEVVVSPFDNQVLIREEYTGRFFWSTIEDVNKAVNEVNLELMRSKDRAIRMSDLHRRLGLSTVSLSDCLGWTVEEPCEIEWGTCTTPDGTQAVHTFEYANRPVMDPEREASFR